MKHYISIFALVSALFFGSYSSKAQEVKKTTEQEQYAISKRQGAFEQRATTTPEDIAEKQTESLKDLLNLNEKQNLRVYEICLSIEREIIKISKSYLGEDDKKMIELKNLEEIKAEKLQETLSKEQFDIYMKIPKN